MPTRATVRLQPPTDGLEFQSIVLDALRQRWRNTELEIIGRPGQEQHGVDIYGPDDTARKVGVQCKCVKRLTLAMIKNEIDAAEDFEPHLEAYFVAVSLRTDAKLQKDVRALNDSRRKKRRFPVAILFWDALVGDLASDPAAFDKHYGSMGTQEQLPASGSRLLALLDLAYLGSDIEVYLELVFGEIGWHVEDPYGFVKYATDLRTCAQLLFTGADRETFVRETQTLETTAIALAIGRNAAGRTWNDVRASAKRLEALVASLQNRLVGEELAAYTVGLHLARWHTAAANASDGKHLTRGFLAALISASTAAGFSTAFKRRVRELANEYRRDESVGTVRIPGRVFSLARVELNNRSMKTRRSRTPQNKSPNRHTAAAREARRGDDAKRRAKRPKGARSR